MAALFSHFGARRYAYNWGGRAASDGNRFCYVAYKRRAEGSKSARAARAARSGFPKFKKRGSDCDRYRIQHRALRLEVAVMWSYRVSGRVRTHENMRKLARTRRRAPNGPGSVQRPIRRRGTRVEIVFAVDVARPQSRTRCPTLPRWWVSMSGCVLATVADADGNILARPPQPRALDCVLDEIRVADRRRSRCENGSRRYRERTRELGALHARARNIRTNCLHHITTDLAKSHGTTVVEGAVWSALAQQKHLLGARTRRRQLHDAAPRGNPATARLQDPLVRVRADHRRQVLSSSKTCPHVGMSKTYGWAAKWTARSARRSTTATTTPRSTSLPTRNETTLHAVSAAADGAQLGLRSSGVQKQDLNRHHPSGQPGRELGRAQDGYSTTRCRTAHRSGERDGAGRSTRTREPGNTESARSLWNPETGYTNQSANQTPRFRVTL